MLAPGAPTDVGHDIAQNPNDPAKMARDMVGTTMDTTYGTHRNGFTPAAAFDVIDLDKTKTAMVQVTVKQLDATLVAAAADRNTRAVIREDAKAIDGMVRFPDGKALPWRADRPAIALYDTFANDGRLSAQVRDAAGKARDAIASTILAHRESADYAPFNDADYTNAFGPTVHFPVNPKQVDTWAPQISETDNAFYKSVGGADVSKVIA